jgi:mono/diheme cytochrome c family protein
MTLLRLAILFLSLPGLAIAQEDDAPSPERGRAVYDVFCQSCHGTGARGDGDFADLLSVQPADLTAIAERNGGAFPAAAVQQTIDGRAEVRGHGVIMPVFGPLFDRGSARRPIGTGAPVVNKGSVADLVAFIETIQRTE